MKKIIYLMFATVFFISCNKNELFEQPNQGGTTSGDLPEVIYATATDSNNDTTKTRNTVIHYKTVVWDKDDAIAYIGPKTQRTKYQYEGEQQTISAEFVRVETDDVVPEGAIMPSTPYAVYPYSSEVHCKSVDGANALVVNFPAKQTYALGSFGRDANVMVAAGEDSDDTDFYFRNACGYLVIKLYGLGTTIKEVTLSALGSEKIAGKGYITASHDGVPTVTMTDEGSSTITLDCSQRVDLYESKEAANWFWFALPPMTLSKGIRITATSTSGEVFVKQTSKPIDITRNDIQPMAALKFEPIAPSVNKLWYTRADGETTPIEFYDYEDNKNPFDATITNHYYESTRGYFVIEFDRPLTTIKASAFRDTELATINIPSSVTTIEEEAFRGTPLTEITLSGNVTTVGVDAFYDCEQLSSVTFERNLSKTPLKIGYSITGTNADGPFYDSPLTTINLDRELVMTNGDGNPVTPNDWAEGLFANKHYDEAEYLSQGVTVTLGEYTETLSNNMFNYLPIQTLTIPGTVTTIGDNVFNGCSKLTSLTFEPSPTGEALTIGYNTEGEEDGPFLDSPLEQVYLGRELIYTLASGNLDANDEGVFSGRTFLTSVTLGEQVHTLSDYMFSNSGITSLTIPGTMTTIGVNVFYGCEQLTSVTFEPSLSETPLHIGYTISGSDADGPFYDSPLTAIDLNRALVMTDEEGETVTPNDWAEGLFANQYYEDEDSLSQEVKVTLGEQVEVLSNNMFNYLPIHSLTIPATVTAIENAVFDGCSKLTTLTFEQSETALEIKGQDDSDGPFYDSPLTTIDYNRNFVYKKANGEEFVPADDSEGIFAISTDAKEVAVASAVQSTVRIGSLIQTIPDRMFCNLPITALTIPATVTTIGNNVFNGCTKIATLTFEPNDAALTLGYNTDDTEGPFYESALAKLTLNRQINYPFNGKLPNDVDEGAFATDAGTLTNVTLGDQVTTLSAYMFAKAGMPTVDLNKVVTIQQGVFCNSKITSIAIPNTVETIGMDAFYGCELLHTVNIQDGTSTLTIGSQENFWSYGPFYDSPLAKVHIGRDISYYASPSYWELGLLATKKYNAVDEVTVTLSNNVKTLHGYMFSNLKLKSITIPASVTYIRDNAFTDCDYLNTVVFEEGDTPLKIDAQYIISTVTYWGPFYDSPLTSITLGREIEYYKRDVGTVSAPDEENDGLFASEENVETLSVTLTDKVKTLSPYMFAGTSLKEITIPASVTSISNDAFRDCDDLHTVIISESDEPITISTQSGEWAPFYDSPLSTIKLYRNVVYKNEKGADFTPDTKNEGLFCNEETGNVASVSVSIGAQVNAISDFMFSKLNIEAIWIPREVTSIGKSAFAGCSKFVGLTCNHTTPPTLGAGAFNECGKFGYISVLEGSEAAFKAAPGWKDYADKIRTWKP